MTTRRPPGEQAGSTDALALYGHSTELALRNFGVSGRPMPIAVVHALALVKLAMAGANESHESATGIDHELSVAIRTASAEVATGRWDDQFLIDVFQTGSGTSTNMNVNEVVATLAGRLIGRSVHPNDHVNASQSSNDTVPTAIRIAALQAITDELVPSLVMLRHSLHRKGVECADVVKAGRTHLMDASPVMLGDEFQAYASQIDEAVERLAGAVHRLAAVPLGGTATGNGMNAPVGAAEVAIDELSKLVGIELRPSPHRFAAQGSQDALVEASAQLRGLAVSMFKIANDIRLMSSGPSTGFGELRLPELQPGSSIMPGKVNPVLCEVVTQVAAQVIGNDATIAFAGTQGTLELNTYLPVMAANLLDSIRLLSGAATDFARRCVDGIEADVEHCRALAERTSAAAAGLNQAIGYDVATSVVKQAVQQRRSVRDVVLERRLLDPKDVDRLLDLESLARGQR